MHEAESYPNAPFTISPPALRYIDCLGPTVSRQVPTLEQRFQRSLLGQRIGRAQLRTDTLYPPEICC